MLHTAAYKRICRVQRMRSHNNYARSVYTALEQESWDLVWAIIPPNSLVKQCARYRTAHPATKLVLDVNDLMAREFSFGRNEKNCRPFRCGDPCVIAGSQRQTAS